MTISVALCTYNGQPYLSQQLASYLTQTRLPDQLVICDDASTDNTAQLLEAFARTVPFEVELHRNTTTLGLVKNFEQAIRYCNKEIIFYSDQDDIWLPTKLERMEAAIEEGPGLGAVFCDAEVVDSNLQPRGYTLWQAIGFSPHLQERVLKGQNADIFMNHSYVGGMSLAFRSRYKPVLLPFVEGFIHDWWTALIIALIDGISIIPEVLVKYRQHSHNFGTRIRVSSPQEIFRETVFQKRRTRRSRSFTARAMKLEAVRDRLLKVENVSDWPAKAQLLNQNIQHLKRRAAIPSNRLYRLPSVIREALTLRYHSYGRGTREILKDLLERDSAS